MSVCDVIDHRLNSVYVFCMVSSYVVIIIYFQCDIMLLYVQLILLLLITIVYFKYVYSSNKYNYTSNCTIIIKPHNN